MLVYFVILGIVLFLFFLSILCVFFYKIKNEPVKCCKNCLLLRENNYCSFLKKTIEDITKLNCIDV